MIKFLPGDTLEQVKSKLNQYMSTPAPDVPQRMVARSRDGHTVMFSATAAIEKSYQVSLPTQPPPKDHMALIGVEGGKMSWVNSDQFCVIQTETTDTSVSDCPILVGDSDEIMTSIQNHRFCQPVDLRPYQVSVEWLTQLSRHADAKLFTVVVPEYHTLSPSHIPLTCSNITLSGFDLREIGVLGCDNITLHNCLLPSEIVDCQNLYLNQCSAQGLTLQTSQVWLTGSVISEPASGSVINLVLIDSTLTNRREGILTLVGDATPITLSHSRVTLNTLDKPPLIIQNSEGTITHDNWRMTG